MKERHFFILLTMTLTWPAFLAPARPISGAPETPTQKSLSERPVQPPLEESARREREYIKKGEDHFFARRFGAALQWFRRALEINPDSALAHAYCGDILLSLGDLDEALRHFRIASELRSNPAPEYFRMGQIYYLKKDREQSEQYFQRALKSDPSLAEAHFYLGLLSYRMGRNREETLTHLKAFRAARPDFADAVALNRAIALLEDPATRPDLNRDLIEIDPLRLFFRKENKKPTLAKTDRPAEPEKKITEARREDETPASVDARPGDVASPGEKASRDGFLSIAAGPESLSLLNQALVFREEDPDRALRILNQAIEKDPRDARLHSLKCEILFRKKADLSGAVNSCRVAASLAPDYRNLQNLGRVQEAAELYAEAYSSYVEALNSKMEPDLTMHAIKLGERLPEKRQETRRLLERMLARRPDHREGLLTLLERQREDGNRLGMRTTLERLQSFYPDDVELLEKMAMILLSDPDTEPEAMELLKRYYDRTADLRAGLSLAGLYLKREDEKAALTLLSELYENHPENYEVNRTILILFVRRNQNLDSAERMVRKFLDTNPPPEQRADILQLLPEEVRNRITPPSEKQLEKSRPQTNRMSGFQAKAT
jgi:tetratricopeptide (TPR) repeat protein